MKRRIFESRETARTSGSSVALLVRGSGLGVVAPLCGRRKPQAAGTLELHLRLRSKAGCLWAGGRLNACEQNGENWIPTEVLRHRHLVLLSIQSLPYSRQAPVGFF